jgi:hypothetical protein
MTARSTTRYGRNWIIDLIQPANQGRTACIGGNSIAKQTEEHTIGGLPGAYFLAAKEEGAWVIVPDGQATPACAEIAPCDFPVT